jgi:hypothetical protein
MTSKIVKLPDGFIGKEDEAKLESFGAYLLSHGAATRWHWDRERGIDVGFAIFHGGAHEELLFSIRRDRERDLYYVSAADESRLDEGKLEHVMAVVEQLAHARRGNTPA